MSVISSKIVKTRKEHTCFGCGRKMSKGSKMNVVTSKVDDISTDYWCETCQAYWNKYMRYSDEIGFGELKSEDKDGWEKVRRNVEIE